MRAARIVYMTPISSSTRLALYYAAYFAVIGILLPFWPVWLSTKGLTATQIGLVLASAPFVRAFASPLIAQFADQKGLRQPIMMGLTAVAAVAFAAFYFIDGFWAIILVTILFFMFFPRASHWPKVSPCMSCERRAQTTGASDFGGRSHLSVQQQVAARSWRGATRILFFICLSWVWVFYFSYAWASPEHASQLRPAAGRLCSNSVELKHSS